MSCAKCILIAILLFSRGGSHSISIEDHETLPSPLRTAKGSCGVFHFTMSSETFEARKTCGAAASLHRAVLDAIRPNLTSTPVLPPLHHQNSPSPLARYLSSCFMLYLRITR